MRRGLLALLLCIPLAGLLGTWVPAAYGFRFSGGAHDFALWGQKGDSCRVCHVVSNGARNGGTGGFAWQTDLPQSDAGFRRNAKTFAGTRLPHNLRFSPGPSKLCLSCHDGSVAPGDLSSDRKWMEVAQNQNVITDNGDLIGNHPVGIPYPDIRGATYNSITTAANPCAYVTYPVGVKIYGSHMGSRGIECTSCHDVHGSGRYLLRVPYASLCASCHIK